MRFTKPALSGVLLLGLLTAALPGLASGSGSGLRSARRVRMAHLAAILPEAHQILLTWFCLNVYEPYASSMQMAHLQVLTGLPRQVISSWMIETRLTRWGSLLHRASSGDLLEQEGVARFRDLVQNTCRFQYLDDDEFADLDEASSR